MQIKGEYLEDIESGTIIEAESPHNFFDKYKAVKEPLRVSSWANSLSPILLPGQLSYTEGVFNCISLAVPKRVMHALPSRALEIMQQFFMGLKIEDTQEILVAGGAATGKEALFEILTELKKRRVRTRIVTPQSNNCSIAIGIDNNTRPEKPHGSVEYLIVDYSKVSANWLLSR